LNRYKKVKKASILGIVGNIFLFVIKIIISLITGSKAMLADTFNSAGDILSSTITFIGNKIASKPSDDDHNLGHGKAEYIYSMIISEIIILSFILIFKSSVDNLINNAKYTFSIWLIIICIVTIVIKLILFVITHKIAKEENNLLMEANSIDHINDSCITLLNLISIIFAYFNIYYLDSIVAIIISIWFILSSVNIFIKSYDVLMDKAISDEVKKEVLEIINSHKEIKGIQHFNSTPVGYKYQISFTIFVDGNMTTYESHKIADNLEKEINKNIEEIYLTVIHVNPIEKEK
jgi:cation diffusion facilitator family transporter